MTWDAGARAPRLSEIAAVAVMVLVVGWIAVGVTLTLAVGRKSPALALSVWPFGAEPKAALASIAITAERPDLDRIEALTRSAVRREPGNVVALRTLGLDRALRNDPAGAVRLFLLAERQSRRDLPTQIWLIERSVQQGDIARALLHYDRALRTGYNAYDTLFPVLVAASREPAVAAPLAAMVARRPPWWNALIDRLLAGPADNPSIPMIVMQARLRPDVEAEREFLIRALTRLTEAGRYNEALAVYRATGRMRAGETLLRDGGFDTAIPLPPFEWDLADDSGLAGVREPDAGDPDNMRLAMVASEGRSGPVARQLLTLQPGRYTLSLRVGDVPATDEVRSRVSIVCADAPAVTPLALRLPEAPSAGRRMRTAVTIPAGCRAQWLSIIEDAGFDAVGGRPWVDAVAIRRLP